MTSGVDKHVPTQTLDYTASSSSRRRRWIVRVSLMTFLLIAAGTTYAWRTAISFRAMEYYWFQRCMRHVTPTGTVIVETDPLKARQLIDQNPEYFDGNAYVHHLPPGYSSIGSRLPPRPTLFAIYVPAELREFERFNAIGVFGKDDAAVFVGERHTPSGQSRLIIIRGGLTEREMIPWLMGSVIYPPTLTRTSTLAPWALRHVMFGGDAERIKLSAGIRDPADRSHLTIEFVGDGSTASGIIDVYLKDDDTLSFRERGATLKSDWVYP